MEWVTLTNSRSKGPTLSFSRPATSTLVGFWWCSLHLASTKARVSLEPISGMSGRSLRPISPKPPSGVMRMEPLRYFGGAISTASCWGAVACRVALILRDGVRLLDPLALRPRAEPRRREFVFLLVFFCSCAITFLGFLLWCLCSVMQGRRAGNPYAAFRAYSSPAARMPSSALSS